MPSEIERLVRQGAADPRVIPLGGGLPSPRQFPRRALVEALADVVQRPQLEPLQYAWPEGEPALRDRIAALMADRGMPVPPERIVVTSGAQQALMIASQIACPRGSRILTEPATYPGALDLFRARKLAVGALLPGRAPARATAAYVMPALSNPTGGEMDAEQRRALVDSGMVILEDDAYGDLRFDGPGPRPLCADAPDRGFFVGTFSKTLAPGLRVGWLVPPARHLERALELKRNDDLQSNGLGQAIVERYLARYDFAERLRRLRRFYRGRARRLMAAVRRELPGWRFEPPQGGFALWLRPDRQADEMDLLRESLRAGISFDPGSLFRPDGAPRPLAVRLCFSLAGVDALDEGARRLARAWRRLGRMRGRPVRLRTDRNAAPVPAATSRLRSVR